MLPGSYTITLTRTRTRRDNRWREREDVGNTEECDVERESHHSRHGHANVSVSVRNPMKMRALVRLGREKGPSNANIVDVYLGTLIARQSRQGQRALGVNACQ